MENIDEELQFLDNIIFWKVESVIKPYKGKLFYDIYLYKDVYTYESDWNEIYVWLELSDIKYHLEDSDYERFAAKFEVDFPEYHLCEEMESVFSVFFNTGEIPDIAEVKAKLEKHSDYKRGSWCH